MLFRWTLGLQFSRLFIGGKMGGSDPMPRHDRLGLATSFNIALPATSRLPELPLLELHLAHERSVGLVDVYQFSPWLINGEEDFTENGWPDNPDDPVDDYPGYEKDYFLFNERLFSRP